MWKRVLTHLNISLFWSKVWLEIHIMSSKYLTINEIITEVQKRHPGLVVNQNWGETGLFYNPQNQLSKGIYLLTFKEKDGKNDRSSCLNREGIFRMNLGISKNTFLQHFGRIPKRPEAGGIVDLEYDFSKSDTLLPHPIYIWMAWVCVLNPSEKTFRDLIPLIEEGYSLALNKYSKKKLS